MDLERILSIARLVARNADTADEAVELLQEHGAKKIGSGACKVAFLLGDCVIKFSDWWTRPTDGSDIPVGLIPDYEAKWNVRAYGEAPAIAKPFMAWTVAFGKIIVQEKAHKVGRTLGEVERRSARQSLYNMTDLLQKELKQHIWDTHDGNWGIRENGSVVLFDGQPSWTEPL